MSDSTTHTNGSTDIVPGEAHRGEVVDEERRLAYVGMTRARRELCLTWPQHHRGRPTRMSRFVTEAGLALPQPDAHHDDTDDTDDVVARRAA